MSVASDESLEEASLSACGEQSDPQSSNRNDEPPTTCNKPEPLQRRKRQLQGGFECVFVEEPPKQVQTECAICLCVLKDPYLVDCCCNSFCQSCIKPIQEDEKPCPLCNMKFTTCIHEKRLQRTLNEMKVYCPHKELGCLWTDELTKLSRHLNVAGTEQVDGCSFVLIECTFCQKNVLRKELKEHKATKCPQRPYSCDYCNNYESTCEDVTTNHWPTCPSRPVPCPNQCGVYPEYKQLDEHLSEYCTLAVIKCPFDYAGCTCEFQRKDVEVHLSEKFAYHMSIQAISHKQQLEAYRNEVTQLKCQLETLTTEKEEIADQLTEERKRRHCHMNDIEAQLKLRIEELKEENQLLSHQVNELKDKLNQDCKNRVATASREIRLAHEQRLKGHLGNIKGDMKKAQNEIKQEIMKHMESEMAVVHNHLQLVPFGFTMPDFEQKKSTRALWYSPSFYTHPCGYKMCIRVDANGSSIGENSHVSVYLYMMRGQYDESLKWPFQGNITILLLNQRGYGGHLARVFPITDSSDNDFCKRLVIVEYSTSGKGYSKFISHSNLLPYLKDDCLKLCIKEVSLKC